MTSSYKPLLKWSVGNVGIYGGKYGFRTTLTFEDGRTTRQTGGFASKREAGKVRDQTVANFYNNTYVVDEQLKVKDYFYHWLEDIKRQNLAYNSYYSYRNCVNNYIIPLIGEMAISSLNPMHITALYRQIAKQHLSVARLTKMILPSALKYAVEMHYIAYNPAIGVKMPKSTQCSMGMPQTITSEDVWKLIVESRNTEIHIAVILSALMGLRKSEILGLKYSDINFLKRSLHIQRNLGRHLNGKTKQEIPLKTISSDRILDIPDIVFVALMNESVKYERNRARRTKEFLDMDYVLCSTYGRPRSTSYIWAPFQRLCEQSGIINIAFQQLRKTYATVLLINGCDLLLVSRSMGHKHHKITADIYADANQMTQALVCRFPEYWFQKEVISNNWSEISFPAKIFDGIQ